MHATSHGHPGARGEVAPNTFRLAKCDVRFIRSGSEKTIKNNVEVDVLARNAMA